MTFAAAISWSLLKAIIVTAVGSVTAMQLVIWLRNLSRTWRTPVWTLVLIPAVTPSLVTGYCYRDTAMAMVHRGWEKEALYTAIIAAQAIPIAVLLIWFAPRPPVSAAAVHCQTLLDARNVSGWRLWLQSRSTSLLPAAAILFLLAFQEADLASLMQTASWTEWLFMRQVGGLPIRDLVIRALVPAAIQLPVLIPVLFWLTGTADSSGDSSPLLRQLAGGREWGIVWTLFSVTIVVLIPAWQLWRGARQGVGALWLQPSTWSEIFDAVLLAVTSGGMAFGLSILLFGGSRSWNGEHGRTQRAPRRRWRPHFSLLVVLLIPGLFGNLTLGLLTSAVFQTPVLNWAYDSPAPLVLGQTLSLLPRVAIVTCCLSRLSTGTEAHVLTLVRQLSNSRGGARRFREIQWRIQGRLWIAIIVLACFWAYFEVVLPSLLAMPGLVPVGMVLYNSLHYGRISALGAKLVLALAVPLVAAAGFLLGRRLVSQSRWP